MEKDFNPKLIPDYSDGIKRNKHIDKLSFGKRKVILSKEELDKLDDLYKKYVDLYGVEIGFVHYLLNNFRACL